MRLVGGLAFSLVALVVLQQGTAGASPVNARVSQEGLNFVRDRLLEMVPRHIDLPGEPMDLFECAGSDPATFELQNGKLDLTINKLEIKLPEAGTIRVELDVSIEASGSAHFEKVFACYGRETCDADISIRNAKATIDIKPSIDSAGKPKIEIPKPKVELLPSNVSIHLSGCPEDDILNLVIGFVKDYGLSLGVEIASIIAEQKVGPLVNGMVGNFMSYAGDTVVADLQTSFKASLVGIDITTGGLQVRGDLDITSKLPPAACLGSNLPEPGLVAGATPDLGAAPASHVGVAVNFGLVQDVLYHVWHEGMLCVTPYMLEEQFGLDLSALNDAAHMIPGMPEGTKLTFEGKVAEPPRVEGNVSSSAKLTIHVNKLMASLFASLPDGKKRTMKIDLDASVTASVVMDPRINALALQVDGVKIDRLAVEDGFGLDEYGFDFARVRVLLETAILPELLGQVGQIPITGPVFGGIPDVPVYVILKELKTTPAYLIVKADLFKAPDNDREAPTTAIVEKPSKIVRPLDAKLLFGGTDKQIPLELLRYRVKVDGKAVGTEPTYVRSLKVGENGKSAMVRVEVHAVDLAGNEDRVGATAMIEVDGVLPELTLKGQLRGTVDTLSPSVSWTAKDDRTAAELLTASMVVTEMSGNGAEVEVMREELGVGKSSVTLEGLEAGKQYRAILTIKDEAGNEAASSQVFAVSTDAAGGGCAVGGRGGAGGALLVVVALMLARRRRS